MICGVTFWVSFKLFLVPGVCHWIHHVFPETSGIPSRNLPTITKKTNSPRWASRSRSRQTPATTQQKRRSPCLTPKDRASTKMPVSAFVFTIFSIPSDITQKLQIPALSETNIFAPQNRQNPKRKRSSPHHPCSGANTLFPGKVIYSTQDSQMNRALLRCFVGCSLLEGLNASIFKPSFIKGFFMGFIHGAFR